MRRPAPGGMRYAPNGYAFEVQKETGHEEEYHHTTESEARSQRAPPGDDRRRTCSGLGNKDAD
jgi:hypothetical protein